jgi:two-component system NtrC family sensor kinase
MRNILRRAARSITAKLIAAVGLLMIAGSLIFWYAILYKQEKDVMSIAVQYGVSFIDFVKESTRYGMLTRHRSDIQQTLEDIELAEGVERVRIFDHTGKIFYSTDSQDIGNTVNKNSVACNGCHSDIEKSAALLKDPKKWDNYRKADGVNALKLVEPIYNEPACYTSDCHAHREEEKILGFVEADASLALLDEAMLRQKLAAAAYVAVFLLMLSVSIVVILWKIVTKPVGELAYGIKKVSSGDLEHSVPVQSKDEIGLLAASLNSMIKDLRMARDQKNSWRQALEAEVSKKAEEIQKTHSGFLQTEKLASLGRMASGIANELNAPLKELLDSARSLKSRLTSGSAEAEDVDVIIEQTARAEKIISNFHDFTSAKACEKGNVDICGLLNRTVFIIKNQKKFRNIKINVIKEDTPLIACGDPSQFQQVFLNMLVNASDAMNETGEITVQTRRINEDGKPYAEISFADTGPGIKDEDMPRLFEPFFTTKPTGENTGLGLSVSHGIVKHLGGYIKVTSEIGKGATFSVRLPLT